MTIARKYLIDPESTLYYHIISRCVRRAFLCGLDRFSGQSFEHRRVWVIERLQLLSKLFSIDVCAYAIMSNHFHLVLKVNPELSHTWTDEDVVERWAQLYGIHPLISFAQAADASQAVKDQAKELIQIRRERLASISWFMKCLNEYLAKLANAEDQCTGAFWEGRFKSQALLDESALISCMAYVDLNPIRAQMASTPEKSDFTSIRQRILNEINHEHTDSDLSLLPFKKPMPETIHDSIPYDFKDYLELVDWTGRAMIPGKRGAISQETPKVLERLNINDENWLKMIQQFSHPTHKIIGSDEQIQSMAKRVGKCWFKRSHSDAVP